MLSFFKRKTSPKIEDTEYEQIFSEDQESKVQNFDSEAQILLQRSEDVSLIIYTEFLRILLKHIRTLVTKYEQAIYRDDYGNVEIGKAAEEINYFINKTVKNGLLTALLPDKISLEYYTRVVQNYLYDSDRDFIYEKIESFITIYNDEDFINAISNMASDYATMLSLREWSNETLAVLFGVDHQSVLKMARLAAAGNQHIKIGLIVSQLIDLQDLSNLQKWFTDRQKNNIDLSNIVTGQEFEVFCKRQLENLGWKVNTTRTTGDFGADLVIEKNGVSTIVQCKFYSQPVGVKAVQEAFSAMTFYTASKSAVISNNSFTKAARQMAEKNNVLLLHISELNKLGN